MELSDEEEENEKFIGHNMRLRKVKKNKKKKKVNVGKYGNGLNECFFSIDTHAYTHCDVLLCFSVHVCIVICS